MSSYKELLAQRQALELEIEEARRREMSEALAKVRAFVAEYALTQKDEFTPVRGARTSSSAGSKVAPKYRNQATGETWTGRGKAPTWIRDKNRDDFLIPA